MFRIILTFITISVIISCDNKPKIIAEDTTNSVTANLNETQSNQSVSSQSGDQGGVHQVLAMDILQADRYTYMFVSEANRKFWIATAKMEAKKGKTYLYKGGLLKTNFESQEFKREFDTIYLVGNVIDAAEHPGGNLPIAETNSMNNGNITPADITNVKDVVKLSDLLHNKVKYKDQMITVVGKSVKVNNGIMGRNWVHIQDDTKSGNKLNDLTITTQANIQLGQQVVFIGKITLDKDFGAGYRYDIIMEEAIIK